MTGLLVNMAVAIFLIAIGAVCTGWLLRHRFAHQDPAPSVLERLRTLADRLASDLDEQNDCISQLPKVLATADPQETQAIVKIVAGLVDANHRVRERLAGAEGEVQKQARELSVQGAEARTDALTQLANRRVFDEELSRRFAEYQGSEKPLAALLIDVDHFKQFNDAHGHRAGDEVLRRLGGVLRKTMREMDLVARYGGEEFGVILPGTTLSEARKAAERARIAVERCAVRFEGQEYRITVSIGTAQVTSSENAALFIRRVDQALYHAKSLGRNCCCYHDQGRLHGEHEKGDRFALPAPPEDGHRHAASVLAPSEPVPLFVADASEQDGTEKTGVEKIPLPGVCDRMEFFQHIERRLAEWKRGGPTFSLAFIEIRGYADLARQSDRRTADNAVRIAISITQANIREMDLMVRYGPGTLALLLPNMTTANAGVVWRRFRDHVAGTSAHAPDDGPSLTLSVGVADAQEGDDRIRLVERTTEALETAKTEPGSHCYCHNSRWPEVVNTPDEEEQPCSPLA